MHFSIIIRWLIFIMILPVILLSILMMLLSAAGVNIPLICNNSCLGYLSLTYHTLTYHWRHGVVVITTAQLHSTKPELRFCAGSNPARRVGDSRWWGSLTMVPAGNKAKSLSSVSHTTKTIHHHHHHHHHHTTNR